MMGHPAIPGNRYKVRSQIGEGGMGKVYVAFDQDLNRDVAIKVINEKFANNRIYWNRFQREARAISALNHPNILTIHDLGQAEGMLYLVTEFIQGTTLRHNILGHSVSLIDAIKIASQVADALAAAHAAGIIHRDIKPENIMIRSDGYIKVLDFGLVKLAEDLNDSQPGSEPTPPGDVSTVSLRTDALSVVGTVPYMSPEQLRGFKVDARTDIWSLGVILYEMVAGRSPFDRPTKSDKIVAVLEHEPVPLTLLGQSIPAELQSIVNKALTKERDARYQTALQIRDDLRRLQESIQSGRTIQPDDSQRATQKISSGSDAPGFLPSEPTPQPRPMIRPKIFLTLACLVLVIGAAYFLYQFITPGLHTNKSASNTEVINLTNTGKAILGAISPDGNYVAHVTESGDTQALIIRSMTTGTSAVALPAEKVKYQGVTFSQDSGYVYFVRNEDSDIGKLYRISVIGAIVKKLSDKVDSPVTFSADGRKIAFVRFNREREEYLLLTANEDGSNEQTIATRRSGEQLSLKGPAWSPDNRKIVCAGGSWTGGYHMNIFEVDLVDGSEKQISSRPWFSVFQVAWRNERTLLVNGSIQAMAPLQIWEISYPDGKTERLTNDLSDYIGVSVARDAKTIVTVQNNRQKAIWIGRPALKQESQLVTAVGSTFGLAWASPTRIVFSAMSGSNLDISAINTDGTNRTQLTVNAGDNYHPVVSSDGRFVVFSSNRTGTFNLWRMDSLDGGNQRRLTDGGGDFNPYVTPDNRSVIYEHQTSGAPTLWKVSIEGGDAIQLTDKYSSAPVVSPDGRFIACRYYISATVKGVAILPLAGGQPIKALSIPIIDWQRIRWTQKGDALTYVDSRGSDYNIWSLPLNGGPAEQLTNFKGEQIFSYDWSPDFTQLAAERGTEISDVFAIKLSS
jgi:serine/threonine protein kinase